MGVNYIQLYGERVPVVHHKRCLGRHTEFYGLTSYDGMNYEVYTDGYGKMVALFVA